MLAAQIGIRGCSHRRVLRCDGTATKKPARIVLPGVVSNPFPEQAKDDEVAMLWMNTGASQFNHLRAQRLEDLKFKFLCAVITQVRRRVLAGLEAVSANDGAGWQMFNDEMMANGVERVFVQSGRVGLLKPFVEFEIKDL